jgi:putative DNA primase/helicase
VTAHLQGFEQILVFVDTDMANAQRFTRLHSDNVFWTPERGWLLWDGRRWQPDEQHRVMGLAKDTARKIFAELEHAQDKAQKELFAWARRSQSKDRLQAMIVLAQSEPNIPAHITEFDTDPLLLNCANGVVNLATGELMTHNPALMLSKITPIEYDAAASCPLWLGFLDRVMAGDDDMIEFLQRAMGYTLTGKTGEQCLFFTHGNGANGKSVFLEILLQLTGEYGTNSRADSFMVKQSGGIAKLG